MTILFSYAGRKCARSCLMIMKKLSVATNKQTPSFSLFPFLIKYCEMKVCGEVVVKPHSPNLHDK